MPSTPDSFPSGASRSSGAGARLPRRPAWIVVAASVVVGIALWSWRGSVPGRGSTLEATVNLVTTDRDDLACASARTMDRTRCEFRAPGIPWPDPPARAERLAAYFTTEQQLLVIPGLFEQPAIAARYAAEEPAHLPRDLRRRFVATCRFTLAGELRDFQTRWLRTGGWNRQDEAWVAVPSDCRVR
jgi:hypothetical protein